MPSFALPDIGMDAPAWLQNFLNDITTNFSALSSFLDTQTQPSLVAGLKVTQNTLGNLASWTASTGNTASYRLFRNTTATFTTATLIAQLDGQSNVSFFDSVDQTVAGQTRFYWVQAVTASNVSGPVSAAVSQANFGSDPTSTAIGKNALAEGTNNVAIGASSDTKGPSDVAVGVGATTGTGGSNTVVGQGASISGTKFSSVAIGHSSTVGGSSDTALGDSTSTGSSGSNTAIGAGSVTAFASNVTIGSTSSAQGGHDVTIGAGGSSGNGGFNIVIGNGSSITGGGLQTVVIGQGSTCSFSNSVALGQGITLAATTAVCIGQGSGSSGTSDVVLGASAVAGTGGNNAIVGKGSTITGTTGQAVVIGGASTTNAQNSVLIGYGSTIAHTGCVVIGQGYTTTATNQMVIKGGAYTWKFPATGGTVDFALTTDGTGVTSFVSGQSIAGLKTSSTPTFAGVTIANASAGINETVIFKSAGTTSGDGVALAWQNSSGTERATIFTDSSATPTMRILSQGAMAFSTNQVGITGTNERMQIDVNGNVGIGTTAPLRALHLTRLGADETRSGIQFTDDSAGNFRSNIIPNFSGGGAANNKLQFLVSNGTNTGQVTPLILNGAGNVGIGSTTLTSMLNVGSSAQLQVTSAGVLTTTAAGSHVFGSGSAASASSGIELSSTTTAILLSRMTTTQRDALSAAQNGMIIYNTTLNKFQGLENGTWNNFSVL